MTGEKEQQTTAPEPEITLEDASAARPAYEQPEASGTAAEPKAGDDASGKAKAATGPAQGPPEADEEMSLGVKKRIARAERQRDEAKRQADEMDAKLKEATELVEKLRERKAGDLDPSDFDTYDSYIEARRAAKADPGSDKPASETSKGKASPPADAEFLEALGDLKEAIAVADQGLWERAVAAGEKVTITRAMVIEMADMDEPEAALAALIDNPERAAEIAAMSPRQQRRELRALGSAKPEEKSPARDQATGQFAKKQSAAPEPISPVGGGGAADRQLDKLSTEEFIARRDAEERSRNPRFGW